MVKRNRSAVKRASEATQLDSSDEERDRLENERRERLENEPKLVSKVDDEAALPVGGVGTPPGDTAGEEVAKELESKSGGQHNELMLDAEMDEAQVDKAAAQYNGEVALGGVGGVEGAAEAATEGAAEGSTEGAAEEVEGEGGWRRS